MSKPRYDWWTYVKGMIRRYPALHAQYIALHETTITAQLTGMPGGGSLSNPTAAAALRELSPINQKEHDAVRKAIAETRQYKDGQDRLTRLHSISRSVLWPLGGGRCKWRYISAGDVEKIWSLNENPRNAYIVKHASQRKKRETKKY